jgi:hypothetical protein
MLRTFSLAHRSRLEAHTASAFLSHAGVTRSAGPSVTRVIERMTTGYPRFFVPLIVRELASKIVHITLSQFGSHDHLDTDLPFSRDDAEELPTRFMSIECQRYFQSHAPDHDFLTVALTMEGVHSVEHHCEISGNGTAQVYAVIFRGSTSEGEAKAFWQHTGFGLSSRCASYWLSNAPCLKESSQAAADELPQERAHCVKPGAKSANGLPACSVLQQSLSPTALSLHDTCHVGTTWSMSCSMRNGHVA